MSHHSRRLKALDSQNPDQDAYTIREFCDRHRMGIATYYKLPPELRPRELVIGKNKKLITRESAAEWRARPDLRNGEGA